jgi:patatin-like phospholipase/acyl hydrolase
MFSLIPKTSLKLTLFSGLVTVTTLLFTSRRIFGDESLPKMIDWTIGCSTGSMLGLALAKGNTLTDCFFLYWEMKNEIFLDKSTMKRLFGNVVDKQVGFYWLF